MYSTLQNLAGDNLKDANIRRQLVFPAADACAMLDRGCRVLGASGAEPGPQAEEADLLRSGSDCQAQRGHG